MPRLLYIAVTTLLLVVGPVARAALPIERLQLPPGFHIQLITEDVPAAREMALGRWADGRGVVFVGSSGAGKVYAVEMDTTQAGDTAARVHVLASGLSMPVGVAYRDGSLFVSAISEILRLDQIDSRLTTPPAPVVAMCRPCGCTRA